MNECCYVYTALTSYLRTCAGFVYIFILTQNMFQSEVVVQPNKTKLDDDTFSFVWTIPKDNVTCTSGKCVFSVTGQTRTTPPSPIGIEISEMIFTTGKIEYILFI